MNDLVLEQTLPRRKPGTDGRRSKIIVIALSLVVGLIIVALTPWGIGSIRYRPDPVYTYAGALQRIEAFQKQETAPMNPDCELKLLTHGRRVARAIVLVHGYTSCPQVFAGLGQRFYELGYNVLIAPLPHHGLADRMTDAQALLRAEELAAYSDQVVDIAHGLGEHVTMAGISLGGNVTAWAAQTRSDLDLAVVISPALGFLQIPTALTSPVMNLYRVRPNSYEWWDATQANMEPRYMYPRHSTRALAETLRLGFAVQAAARRASPAAGSIIVVTNPSDTSINPALVERVVSDWRTHGARLTTYAFDAGLHLPHNLVDITQVDSQVETVIVYPRLVELVTNGLTLTDSP